MLPLLSRNVFTEGFQGTSRPTEFLVLLRRYVVQARELAELAGHTGTVIRVSNCDDARPLLLILGYRTKGKCGDPELSLQTEDAERAFLAIDSGFPMAELEQTLQGGKPFEYAYYSTPAPVLFNESDWTKASTKNFKENSRDLLDTLLNDPAAGALVLGDVEDRSRNQRVDAGFDRAGKTAALCGGPGFLRERPVYSGWPSAGAGRYSGRSSMEGIGGRESRDPCRIRFEAAGQG